MDPTVVGESTILGIKRGNNSEDEVGRSNYIVDGRPSTCGMIYRGQSLDSCAGGGI